MVLCLLTERFYVFYQKLFYAVLFRTDSRGFIFEKNPRRNPLRKDCARGFIIEWRVYHSYQARDTEHVNS